MTSQRSAQWAAAAAAVVLGAAVLTDTRVWAWPVWRATWTAAADHLVLTAAGTPAVAVLVVAALVLRRHRRARGPSGSGGAPAGRRWHWLLSYPGVVTIAVAVALIGVAAFVLMLQIAEGTTGAERPKLQIEAIKYGLGFFAAGGAAAALLLGVRRQQHTEDAQAHTELDAAERRVTDIYTKAVEQIGSADAAVRLGGLYALERVAQSNPAQRQTIVNVLCAYLRMPYAPPADLAADTPSAGPLTQLPFTSPIPTAGDGRDARQELQVRLTAQRILIDHLNVPDDLQALTARDVVADPQQRFWPRIDIDLTGATLVDWTMTSSHLRTANFDGATFSGTARFERTTFSGRAGFGEATFSGTALFAGAKFSDSADFGMTTFSGTSEFGGVTFSHAAEFRQATFSDGAGFGEATFSSTAGFGEATFSSTAWFFGARFSDSADFGMTTFSGTAGFGQAAFDRAWFSGATFSLPADFAMTTFSDTAAFAGARFSHTASFTGARFSDRADFGGARFSGEAGFRGAHFFGEAGFRGTTFSSEEGFRGAQFATPPTLNNSRIARRANSGIVSPPGWRLVQGTEWHRLEYDQPAADSGESPQE